MLNDTQIKWLIEQEKHLLDKYTVQDLGDPDLGQQEIEEIEQLTKAAKGNETVKAFLLDVMKHQERVYQILQMKEEAK